MLRCPIELERPSHDSGARAPCPHGTANGTPTGTPTKCQRSRHRRRPPPPRHHSITVSRCCQINTTKRQRRALPATRPSSATLNPQTLRSNNTAQHLRGWPPPPTPTLPPAHDLVSPLSWPNELPFGHGPPVAVPEPVLALASYVHALVHRREGSVGV